MNINNRGELFVTGDINAEDPPLYHLNYTVIATDGLFNRTDEVMFRLVKICEIAWKSCDLNIEYVDVSCISHVPL